MGSHGQFVELSLACLALFLEPSCVPNVENHEAKRSGYTHAESCPKTGSLSWAGKWLIFTRVRGCKLWGRGVIRDPGA
jgi:hypothetical protein